MFWVDRIENSLGNNEILNDSKTPSGRVHTGSLRGVILHYIIYKALYNKGKSPIFYYGVDDYDPVDELPFGIDSKWKGYMGMPLCNVPPPDSLSGAKNFADYYMDEFLEVFDTLKIYPILYKMSELYRMGILNETIETILFSKDRIRELYFKISGSKKPLEWYPFQVICERCSKIGTTLVHNFDGKEVEYSCEKSMVKWATGCGYRGKVSPFNGGGKLPWKLEWVAKWKALSVSVEGAGKDHSSKGGSREIAAAIYKDIFNKKEPYNIPYEFFLTGKKKMSSSKGIGLSSKDIAELLPPSLLVFLMIRYSPSTVIDFDKEGETIPRLFDEYDRLANLFFSKGEDDNLSRAFELAEREPNKKRYFPRFSTIATLIQIPGVPLDKKVQEMKKEALNKDDKAEIELRKHYAKKWLETCAKKHSIFSLETELKQEIKDNIKASEKLFIKELINVFDNKVIGAEEIHQKIYEATQKVAIKPKQGFKLLYNLFIGKTEGPRLGTLLSSIDKSFIQKRLKEAI